MTATSGGPTTRKRVRMPATSGGARSQVADGSWMPWSTLSAAPPAAPRAAGGTAMAAKASAPRLGSRASADARAHEGDHDHDQDADAQVAHEEVTDRPRQGVAAPGVVGLLGHRLDRVQAGHVEGDAGHEDQGQGAVAHAPQAEAGHGAEAGEADHAGHRPAQDAPHAAVPHGQPAGRALPHPRSAAGQLHGQLATQDHDRAQVLEGGGELELAHELGPALGALQRHAPQAQEPDGERRDRRRGRDQGEGLELQRPGRDGADQTRGRGVDEVGGVGHGPAQQGEPDDVRDPDREAAPTGDEGGAVAEAEGDEAEGHAAAHPRQRRFGQPVADELAADGADDDRHEGGEAQLLEGRSPQGEPTVDRGEEHVAGVGRLDGDRAAPGAGPQPDEDGEGHADADDVRRVPQEQRGPPGSELLASDPARQEEDGGEREEPGQVHLVEGVDPVDVGHPLAPPRRPEFGQRLGRGRTIGALGHGRSAYDHHHPSRQSGRATLPVTPHP